MKKFIFLITTIVFTGFTGYADIYDSENSKTSTILRDYNNTFIFVENGIEFSVFRDGQFDFNMLRNNSRFNTRIGSSNVNLSFNSGFNYNNYIQYDEFGAIIQIENTPVFYDYYGRINQIGNVNIFYNNFGNVSRIGGLFVHYDRFNRFSHHTGFINIFNRRYVYRPWHNFYVVPQRRFCVVYNRPYRQFYNPTRYIYNRPFYNNYRPASSVFNRRGNAVIRNRGYATLNRSSRNVTQINTNVNIRRSLPNAYKNNRSSNTIGALNGKRKNATIINKNSRIINSARNRAATKREINTVNIPSNRNSQVVKTKRAITQNNTVVQKSRNTGALKYNRDNNRFSKSAVQNKSKLTQPTNRALSSNKAKVMQKRSSLNNTKRTTSTRR